MASSRGLGPALPGLLLFVAMFPICGMLPLGDSGGNFGAALIAGPFLLLAIPVSIWLLVSLEGARPFTGKPDVWFSWATLLAWGVYWLVSATLSQSVVMVLGVLVLLAMTLSMLRPVKDDVPDSVEESAVMVPVSDGTLSQVASVVGRIRFGAPVEAIEVSWALEVLDRLRSSGDLDSETDAWYRERLRPITDSAPPT